MTSERFAVLGNNYEYFSEIPKDDDIFYRCLNCGVVIPSLPDDNIGCQCGDVYIDLDTWRLFVFDLKKLEVIKKIEAD
jgi:hypothetical protein